MAHSQSHCRRTVRISSQCFLVKCQSASVILLVERYTSFAEQRRNIVRRLIEDKVELRICLFHFIAFQQAKVRSSKQMILWKYIDV